MSKIDNYIILSIAEKAYEIFNKTNFSTYSSFCKKLGLAISTDTMTQKEKFFVFQILDEIDIIYGLKDVETFKYIKAFFMLDVNEFGDYYKYIKTMEFYHPLLFIDK
jgi:hypothetical protein